MELTRRDALAAVAIASGALGTSALLDGDESPPRRENLDATELAGVLAVADAIYPSSVEASPEFVRGYTERVSAVRRGGIARSTSHLNDRTRQETGRRFDEITTRERRQDILERIGLNRVEANPQGTALERIRYYLVNGLLFLLFTSPRGSRLVGIENPIGYPGGYRGK